MRQDALSSEKMMRAASVTGLPAASVTLPSSVDAREVSTSVTFSPVLNSRGLSVMSSAPSMTAFRNWFSALARRTNSPIIPFMVNVMSGETTAGCGVGMPIMSFGAAGRGADADPLGAPAPAVPCSNRIWPMMVAPGEVVDHQVLDVRRDGQRHARHLARFAARSVRAELHRPLLDAEPVGARRNVAHLEASLSRRWRSRSSTMPVPPAARRHRLPLVRAAGRPCESVTMPETWNSRPVTMRISMPGVSAPARARTRAAAPSSAVPG